MNVQGREISYVDLKARPELWPIVEAEIERLQAILACAHGAIVMAIATDDGLDGDEGLAILREIETAIPSLKEQKPWWEEAASVSPQANTIQEEE